MAIPVDNSVPLTGNALIDGLTHGSSWQFAPGSRVLTYSLSLNDTGIGGPWALRSDVVRNALDAWSNVANITFVEVGSGTVFTNSPADIAITVTGNELQQIGAVALAFFPSPSLAATLRTDTGYTLEEYRGPEGDVFFDDFQPVFEFPNLQMGKAGYEVILHEIGHALGLKHVYDDGGNGRPTFAQSGLTSYDSASYTVMSNSIGNPALSHHAATPMLLDIQALQTIYGPNLTYRTGGDYYEIYEQFGQGRLRTIWDAGGTDTIGAGFAQSGATIDLRPGQFSSADGASIAIAYNVTIENAEGTNFADTIIGNVADNVLNGRGGIDTMQGGQGNDTYNVWDQEAVVIEGANEGVDTVITWARDYTLPSNVENLTLEGVYGFVGVTGRGNALDNRITGAQLADTLHGLAGNDYLDGGTSDDTMVGGTGDDTYVISESSRPPVTYLRLLNGPGLDTGDQGRYLTPDDGTFTFVVSDLDQNGAIDTLNLHYAGFAAGGSVYDLTFSTLRDDGRALSTGFYGVARLYPFEPAGHPGIAIQGNGQSASPSTTGYFDLTEAVFDGVTVSRLALSFTYLDGLNGGSGSLAFDYTLPIEWKTDAVIENPNEGSDTVLSAFSYVLPGNVENLTLTGLSGVNGTGNDLANTIRGNTANNTLKGGAGTDTLEGGGGSDSLYGDPGNDVLLGDADNDVLMGGAGDDRLDGGAGIDMLSGGVGNDIYEVADAGDQVIEHAGEGTDLVRSTLASYTLGANVENLAFAGSSGNFTGTGNALDNMITGGRGNDALAGLAGNDRFEYAIGDGVDTVDGGADNDTLNILGGVAADTLDVIYDGVSLLSFETGTLTSVEGVVADLGSAADTLSYAGSAAAVTVNLGAGTASGFSSIANIERVIGGAGNDTLTGGATGNVLTGGTGDDALDGRGGIDTAVFSGARSAYTITQGEFATTVTGPAGQDTLTDIERLQFDDAVVLFYRPVPGDVDAEGRSDIVWRGFNGNVATWLAQGANAPVRTADGNVGLNWGMADTHGDYDGDGRTDILWRSTDGTIATWLMNGDGTHGLGVRTPTAPNWTLVNGHGDYDGDGRSDLLWRGPNGEVTSWLIDGATRTAVTPHGAVPLNWQIVDTQGDYNADGRNDILWRSSDGTISTWLMNGDGTHGFGLRTPTASNWTLLNGHADYNADGKSDLLWRGPNGEVTSWLIDGATRTAATPHGAVPLNWQIVDTQGDYNADGRNDILWRSSDGTIATWLMNGTGAHGFGLRTPTASNWALVNGHADFDGDGKSDLLWRGPNGEVTSWLIDGATRTAVTPHGAVPLNWNIAEEAGVALMGDAGANVLTGTVAANLLRGLGGADTLIGNGGGDRFVFDTALDGTTNVDTVRDFRSGQDKLLLSDVIFSNLAPGPLTTANFVAGPGAQPLDADDRILYDTTTGSVSYDADGNGAGAALAFATLFGAPSLAATDILVAPA